jgi:hypothetical protein
MNIGNARPKESVPAPGLEVSLKRRDVPRKATI